MRSDGLVTLLAADIESIVRQVVEKLADGHRSEDVDAYLALFDPAAARVTSRARAFVAAPRSANTLDKPSPAA